ncbi:LOW QUALITY PROTEIN: uncharacterized protein Dana_GF26600 [Drosophila ananassae]|uniref:Uncharacterized protein n=1 Tax=Drosophila ananassae TaxID=7217 RepID=A0A0P8XH86_DROAN|nr:LOW QUALITY PROTEIN: uncharacterized protein Dana_GF26600 [Drosophila ananassae]
MTNYPHSFDEATSSRTFLRNETVDGAGSQDFHVLKGGQETAFLVPVKRNSPTAAVADTACPHFVCRRVATIPRIQFVSSDRVGRVHLLFRSGTDGTAFDKSLRLRRWHVKSPRILHRFPCLLSKLPPDTCATYSSWHTTLLLLHSYIQGIRDI